MDTGLHHKLRACRTYIHVRVDYLTPMGHTSILMCLGVADSKPMTLKAANIIDGHYVYTNDLLKLEECTNSSHGPFVLRQYA